MCGCVLGGFLVGGVWRGVSDWGGGCGAGVLRCVLSLGRNLYYW